MNSLFAEHAWLGPMQFAKRVLLEFDTHIRTVRELAAHENPPSDAEHVEFLIPGLVNCHCHLEYSWLGNVELVSDTSHDVPAEFETDRKFNAALPRGQVPFGQWMQAIIAARPKTQDELRRRNADMYSAAHALLRGGCTTVIDSTTDGSSAAYLTEAGIRFFLFHEVLGLSKQRAQPMLKNAMKDIKACAVNDANPCGTFEFAAAELENGNPPSVSKSKLIGRGLNPHATYSVGPWLREQLRCTSAARLPQAWHLSETPEEDDLFRSGDGSIARFLTDNSLPMPWQIEPVSLPAYKIEKSAPGTSAFGFLHSSGLLNHCTIAFHGNTLILSEAALFAAPRALVHCPATHRWFDRPPVPLKQWVEAGVNICLGTDSLASSDTLSMLEVLRMTLTDNPALTTDDVLQMTCTNPALISFLKRKGYSELIRGKEPADFIALKTHVTGNWRSILTNEATEVAAVWIGGQRLL